MDHASGRALRETWAPRLSALLRSAAHVLVWGFDPAQWGRGATDGREDP